MIHLGDITQINGAEIEPVDVITGGSPCQDLSVAGKRAGMSGARSGLFMEQIRIVKEMRDANRGKATDMVRPRFMVWENVPGAFSSNGAKDFRAVLEEIARVAEPGVSILEPPKKWLTAGEIIGDGWSIAWRVMDAQYWGVPQRRRRIALVADFGGYTAPEILFERNGLRGDIAPGRKAREEVAGDVGEGVEGGDRIAPCYGVDGYNQTMELEVAQTIRANKSDADHVGAVCYGIGGYNSAGMLSDNPNAGFYEANTSRTLDLNGGNPACNQGGICVAQCYNMTHATDVIRECGETAPTLQSRMGTGGNQIPLTFSMQGFGDYRESNQASPCKMRDYKDSTDLVAAVDVRNNRETGEVFGTLQAKENGGQSLNYSGAVRTGYAVRRLTPLECERLQGFPDGWTDIGTYTKSVLIKHGKHKGEYKTVTIKSTDSARYKALGNSIALPQWDWLLGRISAQYDRHATLGSLFDGIGGFPLCWERHNGKGSARWASEIEPFPIAVTKYHFPEVCNE